MLTMAIPDVKNFGGSLVHSMFSMSLPDATNVRVSRGGEF